MKLRELLEEVAYIKFKYGNYKHDPTPQVKALDFTYPGQPDQKTYGQRDDVLGWNLNYYHNKEYAKKAIDDITGFAKMMSANKKEMYKRVKYFFPAQAELIRRYQRKYMKGLKHRLKKSLWKKASFPALIDFNKEAF